jgi:hypothetical protein
MEGEKLYIKRLLYTLIKITLVLSVPTKSPGTPFQVGSLTVLSPPHSLPYASIDLLASSFSLLRLFSLKPVKTSPMP